MYGQRDSQREQRDNSGRDGGTSDVHSFLLKSIELELGETPSRLDGYSQHMEAACRVSNCVFIHDLANYVQIPFMFICTAQMYVHQYFDKHSLKTGDRIFLCIAALFLACKVHDLPRSLDVMVKAAWGLICTHLGTARSEDEAQTQREKDHIRDEVFLSQLIHAALFGERALLYALDFQLEKYDVHQQLLDLQHGNALGYEFCHSEDGLDMFKVAFDSVMLPMYGLTYRKFTVEEIAWGHLVFAARLMKLYTHLFQSNKHPVWVEHGIQISHERLDDLVERIAAPYLAGLPLSPPDPPLSTPHAIPGCPPISSQSSPGSPPYDVTGTPHRALSAPHSPSSPTHNPAQTPPYPHGHGFIHGMGMHGQPFPPHPGSSAYPSQHHHLLQHHAYPGSYQQATASTAFYAPSDTHGHVMHSAGQHRAPRGHANLTAPAANPHAAVPVPASVPTSYPLDATVGSRSRASYPPPGALHSQHGHRSVPHGHAQMQQQPPHPHTAHNVHAPATSAQFPIPTPAPAQAHAHAATAGASMSMSMPLSTPSHVLPSRSQPPPLPPSAQTLQQTPPGLRGMASGSSQPQPPGVGGTGLQDQQRAAADGSPPCAPSQRADLAHADSPTVQDIYGGAPVATPPKPEPDGDGPGAMAQHPLVTQAGSSYPGAAEEPLQQQPAAESRVGVIGASGEHTNGGREHRGGLGGSPLDTKPTAMLPPRATSATARATVSQVPGLAAAVGVPGLGGVASDPPGILPHTVAGQSLAEGPEGATALQSVGGTPSNGAAEPGAEPNQPHQVSNGGLPPVPGGPGDAVHMHAAGLSIAQAAQQPAVTDSNGGGFGHSQVAVSAGMRGLALLDHLRHKSS